MNYTLFADYLWYFGLILTGSSVLFTRDNFYMAVTFVFFGQFITMISRAISRISNTKKIGEEIQNV